MKQRKLELASWQRPLRSPVSIHGVTRSVREGLWLRAEDSTGKLYRAECAPLWGWHQESVSEAKAALKAVAHEFCHVQVKPERVSLDSRYFGLWPEAPELPVSVQTALELLLFQEAQIQGHPDFQRETRAVKAPAECAALLSLPPSSAPELWREQVDSLVRRGYTTFKIKVGRQDWALEEPYLRELKERVGPRLRLRCDLNQIDLLQTVNFARLQEELSIDYWEEPPESWQKALQSNGLSWAIDEGLRGLDPRKDTPDASVWILKPNALGLQRSLHWMRKAQILKRRVILSNCYESEWTLATYAWFYHQLLAQPEALGFGTLEQFSEPWRDKLLTIWEPGVPWPSQGFAPIDPPFGDCWEPL